MNVEQSIRACNAAREALARDGIHDRACTMVLFAMLVEGLCYVEAVKAWAAYESGGIWPPERWHSEICYRLLKAWILESPGLYFDRKVEEVLSNAH